MIRFLKKKFKKEKEPKPYTDKYLYDFTMYKELEEWKRNW